MLSTLFKTNEEGFIEFINYLVDAVFVMEVREDAFYYAAINNTAMQLAGLTRDTIGKKIEEVQTTADADYLNQQYEKVLEQKAQVTFDDVNKDNKVGESILTPVLADNGEVTYIIAVTRDITERKKVEEQLAISEKKFQSFMELNSDATYSLDLEGRFQSVNKVGEDLTGYLVEELINTSFTPLIHPDDLEIAEEQFSRAKERKTQEVHIRIHHKAGHYVECRVKSVPMVVDDEVVGVFGVAHDVTEENRVNRAIRESQEHFSRLVSQSPDPIVIHHEGFIQFTNEAAVDLLEASGREQLIGRSIYEFKPISYRAMVRERYESLLQTGEIAKDEEKVVTVTGKTKDVEVTAIPIQYKGMTSIYSIERDISHRKKLERELIKSEEQYRLITEHSLDLIELLNSDGVITYASPSHEKVFQQRMETLVDKKLEQFVLEDDRELLRKSIEKVLHEEVVCTIEIRLLGTDNRWIWLKGDLIPIFDEEKHMMNILVVAEDITEQKKYEDRIYHMAFHDALTGLPNRRYFSDKLKQAIRCNNCNKSQLAVLYLDCDNFKPINDQLGHDAGDEFLITLTKRLKSSIRKGDTIARIGGDEFIILLPNIEREEEVISIINRILEKTNEAWEHKGQKFYVSSSIGVAMCPSDGENVDTLIKNADKALYQAKESGKNKYCMFSHKED